MITITDLKEKKTSGEKIAALTVYDASFAHVLSEAGIDVLLVGDSLGMVVQGLDSTLPVTVDDIVYHAACVARGNTRSLLMVDLPFMSYATTEQALTNAARLMREGGAHMVKLEGNANQVDVVRALTDNGVPVCAHLGLRPQYVHKLGGYKVQGRDIVAANSLFEDAVALQDAGADLLLLECVPASLAGKITARVDIPVIGIGAGSECDGQVLVLHDLLGVTPGKRPKFSKNFLCPPAISVADAVTKYIDEVKNGTFPDAEHAFN